MGIIQGIKERIKDFYYAGEGKWYGFFDKVDSKIPVYKVIDKIDSVIPSFALFLILIFILILVLGYSFLGTISTAGTATFEITNYDGQKFAGQNIIITLEDGKILEKTTNNNGIVSFENIENEILITLDINTSEVRYKETYVMTDDFYEFINLTRRVDLSPKTKTVILQNELRIRILEPVEVIFYCENTGVTPEPASTISQDGIVNITEPFNCGRLYLKPVSDNYESRPYQITTPQQLIQLKKYEPSKKQAIIKIRDNNKTITDTSFNVTLTGRNTYTGRTNSSSQAIIEVVPGIYNVSIADPSGNYGIATSLIEIVDKDGEITVNVSKTVKAIITITIRDESNNALIKGAKVALIKSAKELLSQETDETGKVLFFINDTGDYVVSAKKVGDVGEGYFAKMIDLENVSSDVSAEIKLEKVTIANAGKVSVRVIDQDDEPVDNARVILKYLKNDSIVELNSTKNYVLTDLNGESKLLAGKVEGEIVAYASKHPFFGTSNKGIVEIDKENEFEVRMEVGLTRVNINVTDKDGEPINAVAEIFNAQNNSLTGLINIESKTVVRDIKAGRKIHAVIQAEGYENYTTAPIDLWPDTPVNLSVSLKREITQPSIEHIGLYDESGRLAMGMTAGKKYYTKFLINSDDTYENVDLHFRIGDVTHLTNEYMEVERIEGEGITREMRGISYDPILGYEYDSKNFTVGNAKWITVSWDNFGKGTKEVKVYFRVKANTPPNRELQYFWRGTFDNLRRPESTKEQEFYSDVYFSKIYYQGSVEECETEFCISSEWLYSQEEELYINKPYEMKQVADYKYTFQLLNNSQFNYTAAQKPIYLYITVLGNNNNEKMLRFKNYKVTDKLGEVVGGQGYIVDKIALNSFETQTAVDVELDLEGIKSGGEIIRIRLQSEGVEIFSEDITFNVLSNKPLTVTFDPTKIPSLLNTEIVAKVFDDKGESIEGADLKIYAKEPGYDEYDVDSTKTNRFGTGILNSGAFFPGTKLFVEIQKIGFARAIYQLTLTDIITSFNPETISIQMNTITERDVKEKVKITNQITHDLELFDIVLDSALEGLIKEEAFKSYFEQFRGEEIKGKETKEYELIRAQLSEDVTPQSLPDGHSVEGTLLIGFRPKGSSVLYDVKLPLIVNISSHAPMEAAACMRITNAKQSKVTQTGRVIFNFELTNACQANRKDIKLDNISASTTSAFGGQAEITLQSMTTAKSGRSALSGTDRQLVTDISQNEVFAGTVTYIPSQSETGGSVKLNVNIKGKYGQQEIATIPGNLDLTVDVINLRECIRITSDSSPVAFDASSILTIDASGCQGQSVDIQLCKDDARCAGGVEGGVTLSTTSFNLKGESKTVEVYSPSLPGTYGITVHARQDGTGSFTYIGEAVVGFKEEDTKRFKLNKTDFMLLGNDSRDSALLTNTLLIESVKVKANDCVWGKKSVKFDWPGALTGAMLGASIGSMVGGAFGGKEKEPATRTKIANQAIPPSNNPSSPRNNVIARGNQKDVERLSFASKTVEPITQVVRFASGGRGAGYGALIGAVAGALIMGFAGSIDCADTHNIVEFTDFVTFLQGDQIEIYNMNTKKNETKTIPSDGDAGALDITMGNTSGSISAEWDFRNADYSTEENVALTFKNNGMNEAQAKYGLLTIQAIEHIHGDYTHSNIDNEFDVVCRNSNFSNYWIGAKEDEGLCSGITKRTYSQQYHIRVTSGEPQDNAPYLRKSSSCYMGTLSGSTGRDAVPRIKLNWDWDFIEYDSCDYANPDYIYCDATQFGIALTKRLAILKDFLEQNPSLDCPPNRTIANIEDDLARYDTGISLVGEGFIGVSSIDVLVNHEEDFTTVNIHVDNKTGSALETNMTFSVKGEGEGMSETITETFPVGENIYNIEIDTPEWSGVYMATATFSGPKGNRRAITKAFLNVGENQDCWAKTSTEALAGLPSLYYYVSQADNINYTNDVQSETDLLNLIVFRAHLIKDNYSNSFFNDFKRYYTTTPLQYPTNRSQQKVLENFDNFKINKKYTNESEINAGLYYVWLNVGMGKLNKTT